MFSLQTSKYDLEQECDDYYDMFKSDIERQNQKLASEAIAWENAYWDLFDAVQEKLGIDPLTLLNKGI